MAQLQNVQTQNAEKSKEITNGSRKKRRMENIKSKKELALFYQEEQQKKDEAILKLEQQIEKYLGNN